MPGAIPGRRSGDGVDSVGIKSAGIRSDGIDSVGVKSAGIRSDGQDREAARRFSPCR